MPRVGIKAYDLLVSCPSDVVQFIDVIKECVDSFNKIYGELNNAEIVVKHWSTDSFPQSGDKAQELLNKQFVCDCDAAVALFWTKFGTPTDNYGLGTEEEIEKMLSSKKQVFMYFLDAPVNPSTIDLAQYQKIAEFKKKYESKGIYWLVKDENDLRKHFLNHLSMYFLPLVADEKIQQERKVSPVIKIRDTTMNNDDIAFVHTINISDFVFIEEKKESCISKLKSLQTEYLLPRETKQDNESTTSFGTNNDIKQLFERTFSLSSSAFDADISEDYKRIINVFASENCISIDSRFWNVGNLKRKTIISSPFGYNGPEFDGSEEEIHRYTEIQKLYWEILEYNEYKEFISQFNQQFLVNLVTVNDGNSLDEDVDVKLYVKKGTLLLPSDILIPSSFIIEDILKMNFVEYIYKIRENDIISSYLNYPARISNFKQVNPIIFGRSPQDEYEDQVKQFSDELERIFCYQHYTKEACDILTFHISYLKHNNAVAFPSSLVFKEVPKEIEYEISSKYMPTVLTGKIQLVNETSD